MPSDPVWITEGTAASTNSPIAVIQVPSSDLTTTLTADPSTGTTLAVTSAAKFPTANGYKVRVDAEVMLVTAGQGTTSWTVTRGVDGTTNVAHANGSVVALIVGVQLVTPVAQRITTYLGRVATFRTPGRAGTTGQKIFAIHNATASPILVNVNRIDVHKTATVIMAVTVLPPVVRICRFTAVPASGTAGAKVPEDSGLTSSSSLTVWQDASADGTSSGTALAVTIPASNVAEELFAPRMITAAEFDAVPPLRFLQGEDNFITLRALQGIVVFLDYVLATQNAVTDMWTVNAQWEEYTAP